ncbi:MAG: hypothetical protein FH756_16360 [Firmicutes bacterium]|nr:hypothetical protein [Bacillota bacterium]
MFYNPQTCCQIFIENSIHLAPAAKRGTVKCLPEESIQVTQVKSYPGIVLIDGFVRVTIEYTDKKDNLQKRTDDIPFQCSMSRKDANEGDPFYVTGSTVLTQLSAEESTFGGPFNPEIAEPSLAFQFNEQKIIMICIRKKTA